MKKIALNIIISLLFISCVNKNDMVQIIYCNGIPGQPEYMHFKTENEGYMFIYKGGLYRSSSIFIYKTIDGGENWEQIYCQNGYYFYGYSILHNNTIFGNLCNSNDLAKNNLFKLDLATQEFKLLNFNIEAPGCMWTKANNVSVSFSNNKQRSILTTDTNFLSYSTINFSYLPMKDGIICDSTNTYFITYKNKLVIENNNAYKEVEIKEPSCITKIAENKVLIATQEQENVINLYQFDATNSKLEKLHTIENYGIISHLQSNDKVIVGFVGTMTYFPVYDLIYSTDKGKTWKIQKLKDKLMIKPNCLIDNVLYIYSGERLQKVTF